MTGVKCLFIASDPPVPPTGGGTRAFHFLKTVASASNCFLFVLFPIQKNKLPASVVSACSQVYAATKTFSASQEKFGLFLHYIRLLLAPWSMRQKDVILAAGYFATTPYSGTRFKKGFFKLLTHSLSQYVFLLYHFVNPPPPRSLERYDQYVELKSKIDKEILNAQWLWIDFSTLFPFFKKVKINLPRLKVICNAHNIEYLYLQRMESLAKTNVERKWYRLQAKAMKKAELEGYAQCDLVITCSENDRDEILKYLPNCHIEVLPNGVDLSYFTPVPDLTPEPSMLFTGTMGYEPNKDAVEYFIEKIFPGIRKEIPDCKFLIAGANAEQVFKSLAGSPGIEIYSSPKDMRPIYNKASLVVVPLRSGSGTRLKILEAMAMEKPVVSTLVGAEGLSVINGQELLLANDDKSFIRNVVSVLNDRQLATRLKCNAKKLVAASYSWEQIIKQASTALKEFSG